VTDQGGAGGGTRAVPAAVPSSAALRHREGGRARDVLDRGLPQALQIATRRHPEPQATDPGRGRRREHRGPHAPALHRVHPAGSGGPRAGRSIGPRTAPGNPSCRRTPPSRHLRSPDTRLAPAISTDVFANTPRPHAG